MARTATKPRLHEYRTDGDRLLYVVHVGPRVCRVENCGHPDSQIEEIPTLRLSKMEVVNGSTET